MLQQETKETKETKKATYEYAVVMDFDGVVNNGARAQCRVQDNPETLFKKAEDTLHTESDSSFHASVGLKLELTVCIEDIAFQRVFFELLSRNNILVISGTQRLIMDDDAHDVMYQACDHAFGADRAFLRKADTDSIRATLRVDSKKTSETNSTKNSFLAEIAQKFTLEASQMVLIDDHQNYQQPTENAGYNFLLATPARGAIAYEFKNKDTWAADRFARNQYIFAALQHLVTQKVISAENLVNTFNSLPSDIPKNAKVQFISYLRKARLFSLTNAVNALNIFKPLDFDDVNMRKIFQDWHRAQEKKAALTFFASAGSVTPALLATLAESPLVIPYVATIAIKTTAAMVGLIAGALALALLNVAAVLYLFKQNYIKTAVTVGALNAVGTGLILFGAVNIWNPVGWLCLLAATLVTVGAGIHALVKGKKQQSVTETKALSESDENVGLSPCNSDLSDTSDDDNLDLKRQAPEQDPEGSEKLHNEMFSDVTVAATPSSSSDARPFSLFNSVLEPKLSKQAEIWAIAKQMYPKPESPQPEWNEFDEKWAKYIGYLVVKQSKLREKNTDEIYITLNYIVECVDSWAEAAKEREEWLNPPSSEEQQPARIASP